MPTSCILARGRLFAGLGVWALLAAACGGGGGPDPDADAAAPADTVVQADAGGPRDGAGADRETSDRETSDRDTVRDAARDAARDGGGPDGGSGACEDECAAAGETACAGTYVVVCVERPGGCRRWSTPRACDDGDPCTWEETCQDGACAVGQRRLCDDGNPCTRDFCAPDHGCRNVATEGAKCLPPGDCYAGAACSADGVCVGGTVAVGRACDDGDACTASSSCDAAGRCAGTSTVGCDDGNPCTADWCDRDAGCDHTPLVGLLCGEGDCTYAVCDEGGVCRELAIREGHACDDGDPCTGPGTCQADGGCVVEGFSPGDACAALNPCTTDNVCGADGHCVFGAPLPGAACDDGDPCTTGDVCSAGGVCGGADALACDDGNPCTADYCDPTLGCRHPATEGAACDDGDPCTDGDRCGADGACGGGANVPCDDGDPCTEDYCEGSGACRSLPVPGAPCGGGDACAPPGACDEAGACVGGPPPACDDGNPCTTDVCDPAVGCISTPRDGGACDDGDPCTSPDACVGGRCVGADDGSCGCALSCGGACVGVVAGYDATCDEAGRARFVRDGAAPDAPRVDMLRVPASRFPMGSPAGEGDDVGTEWPQHEVALPRPYLIDRLEVTAADFAAFLNDRGSRDCGPAPCFEPAPTAPVSWSDAEGRAEVRSACQTAPNEETSQSWQPQESCVAHPARFVTWYGARDYCEWRGHRLCTEAEWERAAKGTTQRRYPWGDAEPGPEHANRFWRGGVNGDGYYGGTAPVGSFPAGASPAGCLDMAGNVAEWVRDDWHRYTEPGRPDDGSAWVLDPIARLPGADQHRAVLRGGQYTGDYGQIRTSARTGSSAHGPGQGEMGVRCCATPCTANAQCGPTEVCDGGICEPACVRACEGRECGPDGCGDRCGTGCPRGHVCDAAGRCQQTCAPDCAGRQCGPDGCGGTCGGCAASDSCTAAGLCERVCVPACAGRQCGSDDCGGTCGACGAEERCDATSGLCVACTRNCADRTCGDDGCGGRCGTCAADEYCTWDGRCIVPTAHSWPDPCTPDCAGKECGSDGCGDVCGRCGPSQACTPEGRCGGPCFAPCLLRNCGDDGCGGSCGECGPGDVCSAFGRCLAPCAERECGVGIDGQSCGTCTPGLLCSEGRCAVPATEDTCSVPCPELPGYAVSCNGREGELPHCEYRLTGADVPEWRDLATRLIYVPPWPFPYRWTDDWGEHVEQFWVSFSRGFFIGKYLATAEAASWFYVARGSNDCSGDACLRWDWEDEGSPYLEVAPPAAPGDRPVVRSTCGGEDSCTAWGAGDQYCGPYPIRVLTWSGAREFCRWAFGPEYVGRLCTDGEWTRAAGGTDGRTYPWGSETPSASDMYKYCDLHHCDNLAWDEGLSSSSVLVLERGDSPVGCAQMGSVYGEWTYDDYPGSVGYVTEGAQVGDGSDPFVWHAGGWTALRENWNYCSVVRFDWFFAGYWYEFTYGGPARCCLDLPEVTASGGDSGTIVELAIDATVTGDLVERGRDRYSFPVAAGQVYTVTMTPTSGNPDLFLDDTPSVSQLIYRCAPLLPNQEPETCVFHAPKAGTVHLLVHGFAAAGYRLAVTSP